MKKTTRPLAAALLLGSLCAATGAQASAASAPDGLYAPERPFQTLAAHRSLAPSAKRALLQANTAKVVKNNRVYAYADVVMLTDAQLAARGIALDAYLRQYGALPGASAPPPAEPQPPSPAPTGSTLYPYAYGDPLPPGAAAGPKRASDSDRDFLASAQLERPSTLRLRFAKPLAPWSVPVQGKPFYFLLPNAETGRSLHVGAESVAGHPAEFAIDIAPLLQDRADPWLTVYVSGPIYMADGTQWNGLFHLTFYTGRF